MTLIRLPSLTLVGTFPQGKARVWGDPRAPLPYGGTRAFAYRILYLSILVSFQWGWGPMGVSESHLPSELRPKYPCLI